MLKYEIKKILGNKFVLFFFVALFVVNTILSIYAAPLTREELGIKKLDADTQTALINVFDEYENHPEVFFEKLDTMTDLVNQLLKAQDKMVQDIMIHGKDSAEVRLQDYWPEYSDEIQQQIDEYYSTYINFVDMQRHIEDDLPARYNEIIERARLSMREYATDGGQNYDYRYYETVIQIYSATKNLPISIEFARGWDAYFAYSYGNICLVLFLLILIPALLLDERSNGIYPILRATKRGRMTLLISKYLMLLFVIGISVLSFSAATFVAYGQEFGGYSSLSNYIHVFDTYGICPYIVTVGEYALLSLVIKMLVLFAVGSLLLTIGLLLKNHAMVYLFGLVFSGANLLAYFTEYLDVSSPLRLLNLFTILDTEICFSRYYAVNVGGRCVDYLPGIFFLAGIILVVTAVCNMILFCRIPGKQRMIRWKPRKIALANMAFPCLTRSVCGYEFHKHLVAGKYLLFILAVLLIKGGIVYQSDTTEYSFSEDLYKEYMTLLKGEVTEEKLGYMEDEREWIDGVIAMEADMTEKRRSGRITSLEWREYETELEQARAKDVVFSRVEAQRDYLLMQMDAGKNVHFVYTTSWDGLLTRGFDYVLYAFVLVFSSLVFTKEYGTAMTDMIRITKRGRNELFTMKYMVVIVICGGVAMIYGLMEHIKITELYAFTSGIAPIQSLPAFGKLPWDMTINQYTVLYEITRVAGTVLLAVLTASVSVVMKKHVNTMAVVLGMTMLPHILHGFGLSFTKYLDFTYVLSGHEYVGMCLESSLYGILFTAIIIVGIGFGICLARREWVRKGGRA